MKISNKRLAGSRILLVILVIMSLLIFSLTSCELFKSDGNGTVTEGTEIEFEIKEGMTLKEIAALLEEKGVVNSAFLFRLFVEQEGKEGSLIPGAYMLETGSEYEDVLNEIA